MPNDYVHQEETYDGCKKFFLISKFLIGGMFIDHSIVVNFVA